MPRPLRRPHLARNIALHVVGALGMCVAWAALGTLLRLGIFPSALSRSRTEVASKALISATAELDDRDLEK